MVYIPVPWIHLGQYIPENRTCKHSPRDQMCSMTFEKAKPMWSHVIGTHYLLHPSPTVFRCEPFDKSTKSMLDVCTNHNKQSSAISVWLSVYQYDYSLYSTYLIYVRAHSANVKNPPMAFLGWLVNDSTTTEIIPGKMRRSILQSLSSQELGRTWQGN